MLNRLFLLKYFNKKFNSGLLFLRLLYILICIVDEKLYLICEKNCICDKKRKKKHDVDDVVYFF